jgi:hypothetical protein
MGKITECGMVVLLLLGAGCGSDAGGPAAGSGGAGVRDASTTADGMTASGGVTESGGSGTGGTPGSTTASGGIPGSGGAMTGGTASPGTGGLGVDASVDSWSPEGGIPAADGGTDGGAAWLALPTVPPILAVPAGAVLKLHDRGVGAQIYTCTASAGGDGGATTFAWVFKAPDAKLLDASGVQVGTHGAGPHWTSTVDGSTVNGTKATQANALLSTAIPWLLLRTASTSGTGVFSDVTYIQRVNTVGGKAPDGGCDAGTAGSETSVGYSADYYFYTGGAGADWLSPPTVPAALAVPAGATLKLHERGIGAQVYTCTASGGLDGGGLDGGGASYAWVLKAPDALLYDASFAQVGTHGAGPSWASSDGSRIAGSKLAQASSPSDDAIPWLLLATTPTGAGGGMFSDITFVQRLNTAGGKAPAAGCDAASVGGETRVDYSADYYFFTAGPIDGGTLD